MAKGTQQNVDLVFRGRDAGTTNTIKKIQSEASSLPEKFSKSASALNAFSSASTSMGGATADAAAKIADIGTLVAAGGPLGIAIAAITGATLLAQRAFSGWGKDTEKLAEQQKLAVEHIKKLKDETAAQAGQVKSLRQELIDFGKTSLEVRINGAKRELAITEMQIDRNTDWLLGLQKLIKAGGEVSDNAWEKQKALEAENVELGKQAQQYRESVTVLEKLRQKTDEKTAADERKKKADKESTAAFKAMQAERKQILADTDAIVLGTAERSSQKMIELSNSVLASELSAVDRASAIRIKAIELQDQASVAWAQREDQRLSRLAMTNAQVAQGFANAMGGAFAKMITDSENASKHMIEAVITAAQNAVMAYAAAGAAASAAANAGVPGFGWIVAGAAATAVFGLIRGFLSEIPSFQSGGVVPGFDTGRDSVVAAVRPGERIFTPEDNERIVRAVERGSGGGLTLQVNTVLPPDSAQTTRQVRAMQIHYRKLQRLGMA